MFCKKCGNEINGNVRFCQKCGSPVGNNVGDSNATSKMNTINTLQGANATKKSNKSKNGTVIALAVILVVLIIVFVLAVVAIKSGMLSEFGGKGAVEQESESKSDRDDESSESSSDEERNEMSEENNKTGQESTEAVEESNTDNTDNTDNAERFSKVESEKEEVAVVDGSVEDVEPEDFDYILFDSDSRYVDENELLGFTKGMCRLARNEIYARHGRKFKDEELNNYFLSRSWYVPTIEPEDFKESMLNDYEIKNLEVILKYENENAVPDPEVVSESSYKEAYKNILAPYLSQDFTQIPHFYLGYIDEDQTPELFVVEGDSHANSVMVYTYYNNQVVYLGYYGGYGRVSYAPKKGYIYEWDNHMGEAYEICYLLKSGKMNTEYHFSSTEEVVDDKLVYTYFIHEQAVSKGKYDTEYEKAKNVIDSINTSVDYDNIYEINETNISRYIMK